MEDKVKETPTFTSDSFSANIATWETYLSSFKDKECHALEIGCYEGRSAIWLVQNILTHEKSTLDCVDIFVSEGLHERFLENVKISKANDKIKTHKQESASFLVSRWNDKKEFYDLIYIDGSHETMHVLQDAVLAWHLLKPGGKIIFDDYRSESVAVAVNAFLCCHKSQFEVLHQKWQLLLEKKKQK